MAKTKTPFFSFGSQGTVADALTSQKRGAQTLLREKPLPTYRLTLPQQYHRWLYRDYTDLWNEQSAATKQEYQTAASRYHMPGIAYWLRQYLKSMEDIAGWWRLDELSGLTARDSSPNLNHGTITGATVQDGPIYKARLFDHIDDRISIPHSAALDLTSALTLEIFINTDFTGHRSFINKGRVGPSEVTYCIQRVHPDTIRFFHTAGAAGDFLDSTIKVTNNILYHIAVTITAANLVTIYVNGVSGGSANLGVRPSNTDPLIIGARELGTTQNYAGMLDNFIIHNRTLTAEQVLRHSERRWPQ